MDDQTPAIETWNSHAGRRLLTQLGRREVNLKATFERLRLQRWEQSWLRRVLKWNFGPHRRSKPTQWRIVRGLAEEFDQLRRQQARQQVKMSGDQRGFQGNREHLDLLAGSLGSPKTDNAWNAWRRRHPRTSPDLRRANLHGTHLQGFNLEDADLRRANLSSCDLTGARFRHADLRGATFFDAKLLGADLRDSNLTGAWLHNSDLTLARLESAHLSAALLTACNLNHANLKGTDLRGMYFWGCSYWGVLLDKRTQQAGIKITMDNFDWIELAIQNPRRGAAFPKPDFPIEIDDLQVADFVRQINDHPGRVADMVSAASSRLVLLLGRFSGGRKGLLEGIEGVLSEMGYVGMVFDFRPPENRDVIESVSILAGLSNFVIADLTDSRSTALESQLVIPALAVPFIPIIREGKRAFSMFAALQQKYPWVRPIVVYRSQDELRRRLKGEIIPDAARWAEKLRDQKRVRDDHKVRRVRRSARGSA